MEVAVFSDCFSIIEMFVYNGQTDFDSFCTEWKKLSFQHIYSAQTSTIEVLQTTSAIMHVAKCLACGCKTTGEFLQYPKTNIIERKNYELKRIAALYLMYAIYFKQPTKDYIKIEITMEKWQELCKFVQDINNVAPQAEYILWKLYKSAAFRFTALDYYVALDNLVDYHTIERFDKISTNPDDNLQRQLPAIYNIEKRAPILLALEEKYNAMKQEITQSDAALNANVLPPSNIFKNAQKMCASIRSILKGIDCANEGTTATANKSDLKRKAAKVNYAAEDSQSEETADESDDGNSKSIRRMSSNTVFAQKLPKHVMQDLDAEFDDE